ncbi:MAG: hypothetical protein M1830_009029, partial [Pleopsidium flavum]
MGPSGNTSYIASYQNATYTVREDCLVQFSIPEGSYGCQMELYFPAGFRSLTDDDSDVQLNFWTIDGVIDVEDDWLKAPGRAMLFGTTVISDGGSRVVINSC